MIRPSYRRPRLVLRRPGAGATEAQVRELQRHLRALGYLRAGIDGQFGRGTERAVMALRHDLLHNHGAGADGRAPVAVLDYNRGRVVEVDGTVDAALAGCIADMMNDDAFPKVPSAEDPAARNAEVAESLGAFASRRAPTPFLVAIFRQESGMRHFRVPRRRDEDSFLTVGLDTNASARHVVTSRGYGVGQYTLFHHPPTRGEVDGIMLDPRRNARKAADELREKMEHFVAGPTSGTRADDRIAEEGDGPVRECLYPAGDPRHLTDCRNCALAAGTRDVVAGVTRWHRGTRRVFEPTQYYRSATYRGVPVRARFPCDWPYAARRYNGAGQNSYHYQARILRNLLRG